MSEVTENKITISEVVTCVCKYYGIPEEQLKDLSRRRDCVMPRQMAMYICNKVLTPKYTTYEVGAAMANRDHSTVTFAAKTISNVIETNDQKKEDFREIMLMVEEIKKSRKA